MNLSRHMKRVRVQADNLFLRGERTNVLADLQAADDRVEALRLLCEALKTSVEKTLHTLHTAEEKRVKKVPDNQGAEALKDALNSLSLNGSEPHLTQQPLLRDLVEQVAESQQALSMELMTYDSDIESEVLLPLTKIIREDFSNCAKVKKQLKLLGQELDSARARFRNSNISTSQHVKTESLKEEMDEVETRLELLKDNYACELFSVISKEREMCQIVYKFLDIRREFLFKSKEKLDIVLPKMGEQLEACHAGPVYAVELNTHLQTTKKRIATPIEVCVKRLVQIGLEEEGLFRVAGSSIKTKRLKYAFDACLVDDATLTANGEYHKDYDVHVVAGALKWYLRELPTPLLTFTLHDDWLEAAKTQDRDLRLRSLWSVVKKLPKPNYSNLSYLIQFLSLLTSYQHINKMSVNNLSIVMAPNLIWSKENSSKQDEMAMIGLNMSIGVNYRLIVELLIEYSDYFFDQTIDFGVPKYVAGSAPQPPPETEAPSYVTLPRGLPGHKRNISSDFNKLDLSASGISLDKLGLDGESPKQPQRRKKQAAPLPPQGGSPEPVRNNFQPVREAPTPSHPRSNPPVKMSPIEGQMPPTPAMRLHHSGSIRRPNIEPPKPPVLADSLGSQSVKPPRPVPPGGPERPRSNSTSRTSKHSSTPSMSKNETNVLQELSLGPIGFEKYTDDSTDEVVLRTPIEPDKDSPVTEFRKSLENVIQLQALGQPLTLPRQTERGGSSSSDVSADRVSGKEEQPEVTEVTHPVPTARISKDFLQGSDSKAEVRHDKPALPDKPSTLPRPVLAAKPSLAPLAKHTDTSDVTRGEGEGVTNGEASSSADEGDELALQLNKAGVSVDSKVIKGSNKLNRKKFSASVRSEPFHDTAPPLRSMSVQPDEAVTSDTDMSRSVSEKVSAFTRASVRSDGKRDGSSDRGSGRGSVHQLQSQLFSDSTLEKANGQLIIHKKGSAQRSTSRPYPPQGYDADAGAISRSMEELDQPDPLNMHERSRPKHSKEEQESRRQKYSRNSSCELLDTLAPPEGFQDGSQTSTTPRKPRRTSPIGSSSSSTLSKLQTKPVAPRRTTSRTSSPASSSSSSSLSQYKGRTSSKDWLELDDSGVFSTDF